MTTDGATPPRLARWLLSTLVRGEAAEFVIGDIDEAFSQRVSVGGDPRAARRWYWHQTLASIGHCARARVRSLDPRQRFGLSRKRTRESLPQSWLQDLRTAGRLLRRRPVPALLMISTLALGLGATTAIYSVIDGVLLEPLPYAQAERLTTVWSRQSAESNRSKLSGPDLAALGQRSERFEGFAGIWTRFGSLSDGEGDPEQIHIGWVTGDFFDVLGARPQLGRTFRIEEDVPNGPSVILLSHEVWQRRYGGNLEIVGQSVSFNGEPFEVVGVMPEGFRIWMPQDARISDQFGAWLPWQDDYATMDRSWRFFSTIGRLRPGTEVEIARAELSHIASQLRSEYPEDADAGLDFEVEPLHADLIARVRPGLLATFGAVGLLLLIACSNVANLFLVQASARSREMALRAALGASRGRIGRQLLSENLSLFLLGGLGGLLLAQVSLRVLASLAPSTLPRLGEVRLDLGALGFSLVVVLIAGLFFGSLPVLQTTRRGLAESLAQGGRLVGGLRPRLRSFLVTSEVALAVLLLVGAGLILRSFVELKKVERGFESEDVLAFQLSLPFTRFPYTEPQQISGLYERLRAQLETVVGVESVGLTEGLPLSGLAGSPEPYAFRSGEETIEWGTVSADYRAVSVDYFETLGIEKLSGRFFEPRDDLSHPTVAVVDEKLARTAWPGEEAVGKQIQANVFIGGESVPTWVEVVGVVEHVRNVALEVEGPEQIYLHHAQSPRRSMTVTLRSELPAEELLPLARAELRAIDPDRPIFNVRPLDRDVAAATAQTRLLLDLLGLFAVLAGALAAIGIYGVLAQLVLQTTREIGVRRACGATTSRIVARVVAHGMALSGLGIATGMALALLASRVLSSVVFGIDVRDPLTFAAVLAVVGVVSLGACVVPAVRAGRVDPIVALRAD